MASDEPLRIGLIGLGVGANQLLPALTRSPHIRLTAAADVRPAALEQVRRELGIQTYTSVEELCARAEVEAVWIATPNHLHAEHAITAASYRKHVIVSKPMAITLDEAAAMSAVAERAGVLLLAGHTQSMAPSIRKMADIVRGGELGKLGMLHTWHFTDWMYRPRLAAELDSSLGGGPVFRQASHQVDIVRSIAGRAVKSVRAQVVQLDPARGAPGAYIAFLEFADGTPASIVYSGYGFFDMRQLVAGQPSRSSGGRGVAAAEEGAAKEALRYAGREPGTGGANSLGLFGLTLVTCQHGDIRESSDGLLVYQHDGLRHVPVPDELRGAAELEELYQAVRFGKPLVHDGRWGEATLEVCLAIHESARTRSEVVLARQTSAST